MTNAIFVALNETTMKNISKVNILAAQLRANDKTLTRSESMRTAWHFISSFSHIELVTFKKKTDGSITTRLISTKWTMFQKPAGGASKTKEGQIIVADIAKFICGFPNCVISLYTSNILLRA